MRAPRISVVLSVRNAAAIVGDTLESLKAQTFRDFEVVVVDGASTDGTLELLRDAAKSLPIELVSEPDRSVADGLAKGLARARGDIVGILCADERYYPHTLAQAAAWFDAHPDAVACAGRLDFMDDAGKVVDGFSNPEFDGAAHLACEQVWSILSSFFNRRKIAAELYYDPAMPTCPDYELWARLGFMFPSSAFKRFDVSIAKTFRNDLSMSFRAESFTAFCRDKLAHLDNLVERFVPPDRRDAVRRHAAAGIHMWAAEQLHGIDASHPDVLSHCAAAARFQPDYPRIARCVASDGRASYDPATGNVARIVADRPGPRAVRVDGKLGLARNAGAPGAKILGGTPLGLRTTDHAWGYSFQINVPAPANLPKGRPWLSLEIEVDDGAVGFAPMLDNSIAGERIVRSGDGRVTLTLPFVSGLPGAIVMRSGGVGGSVFHLHAMALLVDGDDVAGLA